CVLPLARIRRSAARRTADFPRYPAEHAGRSPCPPRHVVPSERSECRWPHDRQLAKIASHSFIGTEYLKLASPSRCIESGSPNEPSHLKKMVGATGIEPVTPTMSTSNE